MDRITNPFAPGAGTPPPELTGRSVLLEDAKIALARIKNGRPAQGLVLTGLRGVGKTVLLNEIREMAAKLGYRVMSFEAHEGRGLTEQLIPAIRELLYDLSRIEKAKQLAARALRVLRAFLSAFNATIEGVTYGLSVEPETGVADSGNLEADLPRLMEVVGEAAKVADVSVLLTVDEIQFVDSEEFSALIMALHKINQRQLPIIMIAAGLPQTLALAGNSKSYAERLFKYPHVGALEEDDAIRAVAVPAEKEDVRFSSEALELILSTTQRYPYFLQQWGYDSWNIAESSPISDEDVKMATRIAIEELDQSFFKVRFDRCTPAEKRYMRALADLGPGIQRSGEVAEKLELKVTSLGPVRNSLIRKGMIYSPAHGDTAFTVPLFDEYMKRVVPEPESKAS